MATFERYCAFVAAELGDLMPFVCTINEPQVVALHGYLEGYHPPGLTNAALWKRVGRVLVRAHQAVVRAVHCGSPRYRPKFGLIRIDHHDDFRRVPTPSAYAFANIVRAGRLTESVKPSTGRRHE